MEIDGSLARRAREETWKSMAHWHGVHEVRWVFSTTSVEVKFVSQSRDLRERVDDGLLRVRLPLVDRARDVAGADGARAVPPQLQLPLDLAHHAPAAEVVSANPLWLDTVDVVHLRGRT